MIKCDNNMNITIIDFIKMTLDKAISIFLFHIKLLRYETMLFWQTPIAYLYSFTYPKDKKIKIASDGLSAREYKRVKLEFFDRVIKQNRKDKAIEQWLNKF